MSLKLEIEIDAQTIADTMCSAVEGNDMTVSWCEGVYLKYPTLKSLGPGNWYYDFPAIYADPLFRMEVKEFSDDGYGAEKTHIVNAAKLTRGLALMATKHGSHFGAMMSGNGDAVTANVFLQLVTLGELVYG